MTCSLADLEDLAEHGDLSVSFDRVTKSQVMPRIKTGKAAERRAARRPASEA